jgi:hypothetical protein
MIYPIVLLVTVPLPNNWIIALAITGVIIAIIAILLRYQGQISIWYKTRERKKAKNKGDALKLPTKIKIGKAERIYPFRFGNIPPKWSYIKARNIEIYCQGTGTKNDPFIINDLFPIPKRIVITNDKKYYVFKNLKLKKIGLEGCENFEFKNCEFTEFRLKKCSNITIQDLLIFRDTYLKDCLDISFDNCLMKNLVLYKSNFGFLKDSYIIRLKDWMSRNNDYKNTNIEFLESNKKGVSFSKGNTISDVNIKKTNYKMKKLFLVNLKTELPLIIWAVCFFCFTFIGLAILILLKDQGHDLWYWFLIIPGNFIYFFLIAALGIFSNEMYFKLKLKRKK